MSVNDLPRSGCPSVLTGAMLSNIQGSLDTNPSISMAALAQQVGISHGSAHKAVRKTLRMKKRPARWVPHFLTVPQQARHLQISRNILRTFRRDPQLHRRMITGDESWFHVYDPDSRRQSLQWTRHGAPRHRIPRRERSTIKVMMIVFFDCKGVILMEFVPDGQGITAA